MPSFDIVRTWEAPEFFRVQSVIGSFALLDCKLEKRFKGSLPIDEEPWQIGVIVGRRGTSKTSIEYESDWINITDKCGQNIVITHNLNSTDLIVDIQGKTTLDSGPHQRNYGLTGHMQGWSRTYGGTSYDDAYALVQTTDEDTQWQATQSLLALATLIFGWSRLVLRLVWLGWILRRTRLRFTGELRTSTGTMCECACGNRDKTSPFLFFLGTILLEGLAAAFSNLPASVDGVTWNV